MDFKNYKMSNILAGKLNINMPVDPAIERFIGAKINEKLEMAFGVPPSQQLQGTLKASDLIREDERVFVINIDDALSLFRQFKAAGFKVKRGTTAMGNKGSFFYIYSLTSLPVVTTTVLIDIWRHTPRGQVISMPLHKPALKWR